MRDAHNDMLFHVAVVRTGGLGLRAPVYTGSDLSIQYHVLGTAARDNALLALVCTGQAVHRLLFDCGDGVLAALPFAEIQRIDHLFFSHLHMDHIGGFDAFFRCTYNRTGRPNIIWGPPQTGRILHHRFQGFLWNLHGDTDVTWRVADVYPAHIAWTRYALHDAFARARPDGEQPCDGVLLRTPDFTVQAVHLAHRTPVLGFIVRETPRRHIDVARLPALGLRPGPWLQALKVAPPAQTHLHIDGVPYPLDALRAALLHETPGDAIAYLTDFLLDDDALARLPPLLHGVRTLVCESAYRHADCALARRHHHLTAPQAATLAARAGVHQLRLIHLSERYPPAEWPALLAEARAIFPATAFPGGWEMPG